MLSWSWRSIKLLLLHLVGVPYYFTHIDDARSNTNQISIVFYMTPYCLVGDHQRFRHKIGDSTICKKNLERYARIQGRVSHNTLIKIYLLFMFQGFTDRHVVHPVKETVAQQYAKGQNKIFRYNFAYRGLYSTTSEVSLRNYGKGKSCILPSRSLRNRNVQFR
jgi:hypothetical protein